MKKRMHLVFSVFLLFSTALAAEGVEKPAILLPSPPLNGIPLALTFDYQIKDKSVYAGRVYFIFGAKTSEQPSGVVPSGYVPIARDPDRTHTMDWYKENHPDWIMYKKDRKTPAWGFEYAAGNLMPLDVANPEVRAWFFSNYIMPLVQKGYPIIALDNADTFNWDQRSGHYRSGQWVQDFDDTNYRYDPHYADVIIKWIIYVRERLHSLGVGLAANIRFFQDVTRSEQICRAGKAVDVWVDECGLFTHGDAKWSEEEWLNKFKRLREILPGKCYMAICKTAEKHLADTPAEQVEWAVANFLLIREKNTMLSLTGAGESGAGEYGFFLDRPELHVDIGAPVEAPFMDSTRAWIRKYQGGMVLVNPSVSNTVRVELPAGEWANISGIRMRYSIEMKPQSATVLMSQ